MRTIDTDTERVVQFERLEALWDAYEGQAKDGSVPAGWLLIRVHEAKSVLLGLKVKPDNTDSESRELRSDLDEIRSRRESRRQA